MISAQTLCGKIMGDFYFHNKCSHCFPFVLFWVEAAGEARLRIWLLTLKPLEGSQVCSSSSEEEAGIERGVGAAGTEVFWVCLLGIVCFMVDSQTL